MGCKARQFHSLSFRTPGQAIYHFMVRQIVGPHVFHLTRWITQWKVSNLLMSRRRSHPFWFPQRKKKFKWCNCVRSHASPRKNFHISHAGFSFVCPGGSRRSWKLTLRIAFTAFWGPVGLILPASLPDSSLHVPRISFKWSNCELVIPTCKQLEENPFRRRVVILPARGKSFISRKARTRFGRCILSQDIVAIARLICVGGS